METLRWAKHRYVEALRQWAIGTRNHLDSDSQGGQGNVPADKIVVILARLNNGDIQHNIVVEYRGNQRCI